MVLYFLSLHSPPRSFLKIYKILHQIAVYILKFPLADNVISMAGAKQYLNPARPSHFGSRIRSRYSDNVFIYRLSAVTADAF